MEESKELAIRQLHGQAEEEFLARAFIVTKRKFKNGTGILRRFEAQVYGTDLKEDHPKINVIEIMGDEPKPEDSIMPTWTYPTLVRHLAELVADCGTKKEKTELKALADRIMDREKKAWDLKQTAREIEKKKKQRLAEEKEKQREAAGRLAAKAGEDVGESEDEEEETDSDDEEEEVPLVFLAYEFAAKHLGEWQEDYAWDCSLM